jgi:hypothetical protein
MAYNEVTWKFPQYSAYSVLNAVVPGVCWRPLENNPSIAGFEVEYLDAADGAWINIGTTSTNYIRFPSDVYASNTASYRLRIATIGVNGKRSPFSLSVAELSSPLVFDFTASRTVRYSNGTTVPNQRLIFLVL